MINLSVNNLKSDLVGDVLPNIFFNKVTLDTKNEPIPESNPHIDVEREGKVLQTGKNKRIFHDGFNTNKDNLLSKNLITKINFTIYNSIDKATDDSWFKNVDLLDFVYVRLIQSTSEEFTTNFVTLNYPTKLENVPGNKSIKIKIIPLKDLINETPTNLTTDTKFVNQIDYNTEFTIKGLNQKHLTLFANCYLDLDEFVNKFQLNLPNSIELKGNTTVENVITSNQVNNNSHIYVASDGSLYTGKVTKTNGNFYTSNVTSPKLLTKLSVTNLKVKDKRNTEDTFKKNNNIKSIFNKRVKIDIGKKDPISNLFISKDDVNILTSYIFVDFLEAIKENIKYKFIFENNNELILSEAMSYVKLKNLSFFRKRVFDNNSLFNKEQNKLLINTTESKQGTVKNNLSFYTKYRNFVTFDSKQIKSKNFASSLPSSETIDSLFKVAEVKENVLKNVEYLRCFVFTDYEMSKLTDGKYQYSVSFEIEDNTKQFILNYYNKLLRTKKDLLTYYNNCYNNFNEKIDSLNDEYMQVLINNFPQTNAGNFSIPNTISAPWVAATSLYFSCLEILDNKEFSEYEIDNLYKLLHPKTTSPNEINYVIKLFDDLLVRYEQILDIKNDANQKNIQNFDAKNILIAKTFKNIFDSNERKNIDIDFIGLKLLNNKITLSSLTNRVQREKRKYFNSDTLQPDLELSQSLNNPQLYNDLYDLDTTSTSFLTPAVIRTQASNINLLDSGEDLWNAEKYNLVNSQVLNTKNKPKRTPLSISSAQNVSSRLSNSIVNDFNITIEEPSQIDLISPTQNQFQPSSKDVSSWLGASSTFKSDNLSLQDEVCDDVKEKLDVSLNVREVDSFLKALEAPTQFVAKREYNIKDFNIKGNTSIATKMNNKTISLSNRTNTLRASDVSVLQRKSKAITTKVNISNVQNINVSKPLPQSNVGMNYSKMVPIQIKSLMLGNNKSVKKNFFELGFDPLVHPDTKNIIKYNFQTIVKLEYLSGFEIFNGRINLNKPIWSLLTKNIFDTFVGDLFIRQTKYEDKTIDFVNTDDELNITNKYFVLDSEKQDTAITSMVEDALQSQPAIVFNKNIITTGAITQATNSFNLARTSENKIKKNLLIKNASDISVDTKFIRTFEV